MKKKKNNNKQLVFLKISQKTEAEKNMFPTFLNDKKKKHKQKYITSKDGTLSVPDKANGIAKKPNAIKRPVNVRTSKRW